MTPPSSHEAVIRDTRRRFALVIACGILFGVPAGALMCWADRFDKAHPPRKAETIGNPYMDAMMDRLRNPGNPVNPLGLP